MQNYFEELGKMHRKINKEICIVSYGEIRDKFNPHAALNSSNTIMIHILNLQQSSFRINKLIFTYVTRCGLEKK